MPSTQHELTSPAPLLAADGRLTAPGWSRSPVLDCNLERVAFYPRPLRFLQRFRVKRWDYYAVTTPTHFFSFTLAGLGYAGQAFVYAIDFDAGCYHEESVTIPLAKGVELPRNSTGGQSHYTGGKKSLSFEVTSEGRRIVVDWPGFDGKGLSADFSLRLASSHQSTVVVIPIRDKRFYYNRKINCLPATGTVQLGDRRHELSPQTCLGNLDWGRGVWEYKSFWVWASASGFLPNRRTVGLNLGYGFGDTSAATENTVILEGRVHKLGQVDFTYDSKDFKRPWRMNSPDGGLDLVFTPFLERVAKTNLLVITSEVHQMFGRYSGTVAPDGGERIKIDGLVGFAEEHHAHW
jgi:hypothetical protein